MISWSWVDVLIIFILVACNLVRQYIVAPGLRSLSNWKQIHFPTGVLLLPAFLTAIYCFGRLSFKLNILPYYFLTLSLVVGTTLYDYVKRVNHFSIYQFIRYAFQPIFWYSFGYLLVLLLIRFLI